MRNLLGSWIAVLLCIASCTGEKRWQIDGEWETGEGKMVYLEKILDSNQYRKVDSVVVNNGRFQFSGLLEIDRRRVVAGNNRIEVLLDDTPVKVCVVVKESGEGEKKTTYEDIEATGSQEQDILQKGKTLSMAKDMLQLGSMFAMLKVKDDPGKLDSVARQMEYLNKEVDQRVKDLLDSNVNCYASAFIIGDFILSSYTYEEAARYYGQLTERVKLSAAGLWLEAKMGEASLVNVGGIAPEIALPDPDGRQLKLSALRGKYVLLDFWSSWCGPCLAEMPNIKAIYNKYHDRGFEIYGVSLDEKAELWQKAIREHGLSWLHVSSLKGWKCPVAQRYGIKAIPKMYLLDKEGHIIAMDLRGEALRQKVESLFD